ncbi:MAG: nicotinamide mononucleotide transporter [Clostridia bacterium]|nr:nicotinamide mononucleotide transporter [Clostridia bacterium]
MSKVKRFFKSFTPYQIIYLSMVFILVALFTIFLPDEMLEDMSNPLVVVCSVLAVLANPICELLISKQSKWNFIVSIVFIEVTESILYFSLGYYSVALISIIFWIPIDIASFVNWHKHPDREEDILTNVKKLSWKQDILIVLGILAFGFGVGFLLTLIPGAEDTYFDAFCSALGMANGILLLLRYNEQWFAWLLCLIFEAILYILSGSYIMLITVFAMLVNTCYGFVKWLIYIKNEKKTAETKSEQMA